MTSKLKRRSNFTRTAVILVSILIAVIFMGIFIFESKSKTENIPTYTADTVDSKTQPSTSPVLVIGDPNAKVTIIEYTDYKCPECGKFHQAAGKEIRKDYVETGLANIVFRPYPVYSEDGAKALAGSYCANNQGKFLEYHDALFEYMWTNHFQKGDYQKAIDPVLIDSVMTTLLADIGIDKSAYDSCAYDSCLTSKDTEKAYYDDIYLAAPDEIQGTPSFIIGGQKIVGPQPYTVFKTLLDIQLR